MSMQYILLVEGYVHDVYDEKQKPYNIALAAIRLLKAEIAAGAFNKIADLNVTDRKGWRMLALADGTRLFLEGVTSRYELRYVATAMANEVLDAWRDVQLEDEAQAAYYYIMRVRRLHPCRVLMLAIGS